MVAIPTRPNVLLFEGAIRASALAGPREVWDPEAQIASPQEG